MTRKKAHQHGEQRCLNILRQLSAYIDDELPEDIRDTVKLCRQHEPPPLSAYDRARLRQEILRAWKPEARA